MYESEGRTISIGNNPEKSGVYIIIGGLRPRAATTISRPQEISIVHARNPKHCKPRGWQCDEQEGDLAWPKLAGHDSE